MLERASGKTKESPLQSPREHAQEKPMTNPNPLMHMLAPLALTLVLCTGLSASSSAALPNTTSTQYRNGIVWLSGHEDNTLHLTGDIPYADAHELADLGGALMVARRSSQPCKVEFNIAGYAIPIASNDSLAIDYYPLEASQTATEQWRLESNTCEFESLSMVLLVGPAAAYAGENPQKYWTSLIRTRPRQNP